MYLMYAGYLAAFYATLTVGAAVHLPHHPHPLAGAVAYFLVIPVLLLAVSVEVVVLAPAPDKDAIRRALRKRTLTRLRAFATGFAVGAAAVVAIGIIGLAAYWLGESRIAVVIASALVMAVAALSPAVGAGLLVRYVRRQLPNHCKGVGVVEAGTTPDRGPDD